VHIFYDQTAVYVGAILCDSAPDSIFNFFSERENIGMSDYFSIYFDPYNRGQLAYGFFITPAGIQTDIKAVKSGNYLPKALNYLNAEIFFIHGGSADTQNSPTGR